MLLPDFSPTKSERQWVENERATAAAIRMLWRNCPAKDKKNFAFLHALIVTCWVNGGQQATRKTWRNRAYKKWLALDDSASDSELAGVLARRLRVPNAQAMHFVSNATGITDYYKPLRPQFMKRVEKNRDAVYRLFSAAANGRGTTKQRIATVARAAYQLPAFKTPQGSTTKMMNGLAPVLACLDPKRRFPIVNSRTEKLLNAIGARQDEDGVVALSGLIGNYGITDAFELDVYATSRRTKTGIPRRPRKRNIPGARDVGLKDERNGIASLARRSAKIARRHNKLINKFCEAVQWRYRPRESEYDIVIDNWSGDRLLLIEAKTETAGPGGRAQLRQAVGQLLDYRWRSFRAIERKVDLALLVPSKPSRDVLEFLGHLGIAALWFEGTRVRATSRKLAAIGNQR